MKMKGEGNVRGLIIQYFIYREMRNGEASQSFLIVEYKKIINC